jgi:hypothetical protein
VTRTWRIGSSPAHFDCIPSIYELYTCAYVANTEGLHCSEQAYTHNLKINSVLRITEDRKCGFLLNKSTIHQVFWIPHLLVVEIYRCANSLFKPQEILRLSYQEQCCTTFSWGLQRFNTLHATIEMYYSKKCTTSVLSLVYGNKNEKKNPAISCHLR